ncbi:protein SCO1/2 [Paracoccus isoporae]|uniref:Protein SCO1/2 n=1 Tax=Paracoccus isoporae TaxID=591205 RepID=A0A1G6UVC2_9RHOB|nr:SCO family protein [Paracoccus isoporae]SDD45302.1 protein SCO1/2 [Paracoccus isoporae]
MNEKGLIAVGCAATVGLLLGGWLWMENRGSDDPFAPCRTSVVAGGTEQLGGPFELTDETGARITDADLFTKPTLLYFGYAYCPDVCPLDNSRNAEALDLLSAQGVDAQAAFISVDPKRDTPEVMADYTFNMHENMIGLTGSEEDIAAAAKEFRVAYQIQDDGTPDYLVSHTTMTYLVLPEAGTVEFFNRDVTPERMAEQVACFANAA